MSALRTILFLLVFYPVSLLFVLTALLAALAGREPLLAVVTTWVRFHRGCASLLLGIRTRIEGAMPDGPVLIAAKHQSMFETIEMVAILDRPAVVLKRELADLPGWGRAARLYGVIPIDRAGGATALRRMMKAAEEAIKEGRSIVIFPEGTRVQPGEQPPLQPGFAGLYRALKLPVVAVALDSGRLWPRGRFAKHAGVVTMHFHEPIPAGLPRADIEAQVHRAINLLDDAA
jgi:1-acyl-sn-glycerol-3-phosphate acyltransferase